jgi:hypothetical protein
MSKSYEEEEKDIQTALLHHRSAPELTWFKSRRLGGQNKALSDDQEIALVRVIDRYEHDGLHCRVSMIKGHRRLHTAERARGPRLGPSY